MKSSAGCGGLRRPGSAQNDPKSGDKKITKVERRVMASWHAGMLAVALSTCWHAGMLHLTITLRVVFGILTIVKHGIVAKGTPPFTQQRVSG